MHCSAKMDTAGVQPGGSREFEVGTASARIRKQLLNQTLIKDIKTNRKKINKD